MHAVFHGDSLEHRGQRFEMIDQPLEHYFELIGQRPDFGACQPRGRGYAASWILEDGWLYLSSLVGHWGEEKPLSMRHMFPFAGPKVFAAWFSGNLRAYRSDRPLPAQDEPNRMRYPDVVLQIEHGRLSNVSMPDHAHASAGLTLVHADDSQAYAAASAATARRHASFTQAVV